MKIELKEIGKYFGNDFQIEHLNMTIESKKRGLYRNPMLCERLAGRTRMLLDSYCFGMK